MDFGTKLLLTIIAPIASAFLPRQIVWFGFGLVGLAIGLVALDVHTTPSTIGSPDDMLIVLAWSAWSGAALFARWGADLYRNGRIPPFSPWLGWALPVGFLISVCLFHWLSNRMAGAQPAWLMHWLVGGGAVLFASFAWAVPQRWYVFPSLRPMLMSVGMGMAFLVAKAAGDVSGHVKLAIAEAAGDPFCLLSFAGSEHPREIATALELSALVSRRGGRSAVEYSGWIVVARQNGVFPDHYRSAPPCTPVPGGNLEHLARNSPSTAPGRNGEGSAGLTL